MRFLAFCLICLLPSCGSRYYRWGADQFHQVTVRPDTTCGLDAYRCSVTLYDEFTTVGMFDMLWFSPEVRTWYDTQVYERYGKPMVTRTADDDKLLVIYLALSQPETSLRPLISTVNPQSDWAVTLVHAGSVYPVKSLKRVMFEPEIKVLFGKHYNRYRAPYRLTFDRFDAEGHDLTTGDFKIVLKSAKYEISCCFDGTQRPPVCIERR